ncbi:MAG: HlyC/CorC family transporter [Solobacterium sp.]|nr:HlyC/CorC family transporter [Solobacterium sp.]
MTKEGRYVLILIILIILSGLFSAIETAFSSANRIRLKNMANSGNVKAQNVLTILEDYDRFLTTVLIGNNIVNIASATIGTLLFTMYFGEDRGPTISTVVITIIVLVFGEIAPKSIAKNMPEKFSCSVSGFVQTCKWLFTPFTWILSGWTKFVNALVHTDDDDSDIADELITMVDEAEKEGDLAEHESDLISAAIEFNDLDVSDILTPRVDVLAVDLTSPVDQIEKVFRLNSFSRLPVFENSIDNIVGVIHEKDFYDLMYHNKGPLRRIIKPVIYTSGNTKISTVLRQLQGAKLHLAVVLDEYGGTEGIITLEDIIEELVGEIWDEHDTVKEFYTEIDEHTWLIKADCEVDDLFDRFDVDWKEDEDDDFITVSGWAIHALEHIPKVGEEFDYQNLHVTVTKADQRKVIEVKVEIRSGKEKEDD